MSSVTLSAWIRNDTFWYPVRAPKQQEQQSAGTWQSRRHNPDRPNRSHQHRPDVYLHSQAELDHRWHCKGFCPEWLWPGHPHWLFINNPRIAHRTAVILGIQRWASLGEWYSPQEQTGDHPCTPETRHPHKAAQWPPKYRVNSPSRTWNFLLAKNQQGHSEIELWTLPRIRITATTITATMQMHKKPGMPWVKVEADVL